MIKSNYYFQMACMSLSAVLCVSMLFGESMIVLLMLLQVIIGASQYLASTVLIASKVYEPKLVRIHWGLSTVVLLLLGCKAIGMIVLPFAAVTILLAISWGLAVFFAIISYRLYYGSMKQVKHRFLNLV